MTTKSLSSTFMKVHITGEEGDSGNKTRSRECERDKVTKKKKNGAVAVDTQGGATRSSQWIG